MSERIMTLFGEEIIPEQLKAVGKSRAKKKTDEQDQPEEISDGDKEQESQVAAIEQPRQESAAPQPLASAAQPDELPQVADEEPAATSTEIPQFAAGQQAAATEEKPVKVPKKKTEEANIILPEDWQGDKTYYSIGEVADLFKVKTSHIRFWTNEFKLKVRTTRKGDRLFTPEQIRELRTIHHLVKERGFTLTGAKAKLKEPGGLDVQTMDLKQSLLQLRNKLVIIKNQLM